MTKTLKPVSAIRHRLDLKMRHFERSKNGFTIIGSWWRKEGRRWTPCMVILPRVKPTGRRMVPCVILLEDAWRWAMHNGIGDPEHCIEAAAVWFDEGVLPGTPFNKHDHMRLYDAINESLPDLIAMPPRPKGETVSIGAIQIHKETGEIIERELFNDV